MKIVFKTSLAVALVVLFMASLAAPVLAQDSGQVANTGTAQNYAPVIVSITPSTQNLAPVPDGRATANIVVRITDPNGYSDLFQSMNLITPVARDSNPSGWFDGQLYGPTQVNATTADVQYSIVLNYNAPAGAYVYDVTAMDSGNAASASVPVTINYGSALGLTVDTPSLAFGTFAYATSTADQSLTIHNSANTPLDVTGTATQWTSDAGGSNMPANALHATVNGADTPLSDTTATALTTGMTASATIPMHVAVPALTDSFTMSGNYASTTTLTASAS